MILTTDPIITAADAQAIFDFTDNDNLIHLINALSAKARASMGRVQLNQNLTTAIKENHRGLTAQMIFLHAPVHTDDFSTYDMTVKVYVNGSVLNTYSADDGDIVVTSDDYSSRVDLVNGWFPASDGASWIEIEYYGGWATIPGDVYMGAIQQGRVDLKRLKGEVGMSSHSGKGDSVQMDRDGVIQETADLWRKYKMIV